MRIWVIQSVLSPYRIKLFQKVAETAGVRFTLVLLTANFKTRPQWKRRLCDLPFGVDRPLALTWQTSPEKQYCINPFLMFKLLWEKPDVVICSGFNFATLFVYITSLISCGI